MRRKAKLHAFAGKNNSEEDKHEKKIVIGFSRCDDGADYGAGAFAADGDTTLQSKIDEAANGSTVTLDKDYTENIIIKSGRKITLDLGSNTLTNNGGDTITVELGATLTVTGNGESADKDGSAVLLIMLPMVRLILLTTVLLF